MDGVDRLVGVALTRQDAEINSNWDAKNSALQELIDSATQEVFEAAARLCNSDVHNERLLGVRILRELGRPGTPFGDRSVDLISGLAETESDAELLRWEISALGFQRRAAALPTLLSLAHHPKATIRDAVASAISGAQRSGLDDPSLDALVILARDPDDEVRFSAVFELASWFVDGVDNATIRFALERASFDSDYQMSRVASDSLRVTGGMP